MSLLDELLVANGGLPRWHEVETIKIHQLLGGELWKIKGVDGIIDDSVVEIRLKEEHAWHRPLPKPGFRSSFTPDLVVIETDDDTAQVVESLPAPRASFDGHTLTTPWSMLQLAYFAGYAMWTYLSEPFSFTLPGVRTEELGVWHEDGETWRRLAVRYPANIATHSAEQVLYVDTDGLLRRRDYAVDISEGFLGAHYMHGHQEFDGLVLPTERVVYARGEDNQPLRDQVAITIDVHEVTII